jgi:hypothetical protein
VDTGVPGCGHVSKTSWAMKSLPPEIKTPGIKRGPASDTETGFNESCID